MSNPNIINVTSIIGRTNVLAVTTTPTDILVNASGSGTVVKVNNLVVANINGTTAADVSASIFRASTEWRIAHTIAVPADSSLVVIDKTTSIYLEPGDSLRLTASSNSFLHATCSYEIIS